LLSGYKEWILGRRGGVLITIKSYTQGERSSALSILSIIVYRVL
jgi:hypothetical protein